MSLVGGLAGGILSAVVALLLAQGFQKVEAASDGTITGLNKDGKPFSVRLANPAISGAQYDLVELDTGVLPLTKPKRANYSIENTQDTDKRVFALGLVPDALFKTSGIIEIFINKVRVFPITDPVQGFLSAVTSLNIPIPPNFGLKIKPRGKLEVFVWNPSGASAKINFAVFIGDF